MCCTRLAGNTGCKGSPYCEDMWRRYRLLASLGDPSNFQWVSRLGFVTSPRSLNGGQPNFARCLAVSWGGTLYFSGDLAPSRNFARCNIRFASKSCVLLYWQGYCTHECTALAHWVSAKLRRSAEGATYSRQGGHHVGHRPTFQSLYLFH